MDWKPQFDSAAWKETLSDYMMMLTEYGPPGASNNGFNENLALFQQGKCGMWIDATVAASFVTNPKDSTVADKVGFAMAPNKEGVAKHANWLWAWNLAIPAGSKKVEAAKSFIEWATSKEYLALVASKEGWANVPPGTRTSLYENPEYAKVPFAKMTLDSINAADPTNPAVDKVPYVGVQFVAIPEFQGIGTAVGQQFSATLAGTTTADQALANAQSLTEREMKKAGYIK
jgi:sorbitol/mannitol transport system substrate-binding protein